MALGNTSLRIIVSIIFIPVILAAAYFGSTYFFLFISIVGLISYHEYVQLIKKKNAFPLYMTGFIINLMIYFFFYVKLIDITVLILIITLYVFIIELFRNKESAILNSGVTLMSVLYLGFFMGSVIGIREFYTFSDYSNGGYLIISILVSIWLCDTAAFFGGTTFGKHKLFPRVSPNKSWEGAIFGFIFAVGGMILAKYTVLNFLSYTDVIIIGIIVGTIGQLGDLVESLLKRDAGVKDSSNIIPGHGGILDRFDSLLFVAPAVYVYLSIIYR